MTSRTPDPECATSSQPKLERSITLPWLIFYGVGVTVGAGIFALIGEILALAGDKTPLSFLVAGAIAAVTGVSYILLVRRFPKAGGEAVFVNRGLGPLAGRAVGFGVVVTGTISSAVIALAFGGYLSTLINVNERLAAVVIVGLLALVAWWGVKESVVLAGVITLIEIGALIVVVAYGLPLLRDGAAVANSLNPTPVAGVGLTPVLAGAVVAFFAFVGFEDLENMAEETVDPRRTTPLAIAATLVITIAVYVLLGIVAVLAPNREAITESSAPLAALWNELSGFDARPMAAIAAIAMINGILVQILMASRVLYGMAGEGLLPSALARVDASRHTPSAATAVVAVAIAALAAFFPLVGLAKATSLITLTVFSLVNLSLFTIGTKLPELGLRRLRWVGLVGAALAFSLAVWQLVP